LSEDLRSFRVSDGAIFSNCAIMTCVVSWVLGFNLIQILLSWIVGLFVFLFYFVLFSVIASWDMLRNPWIRDLHFTKWSQLTASHYSAWLLEKDEGLWRRYAVFIGLPISVSISSTLFNILGGVASSLFSILLSFLLLVVQVSTSKETSEGAS